MKLKLPKRRIWRVAIYLVSTLLILLAIDLILVQIGRHIAPGHDTTRITEPTMPNGDVDYLTAIEDHFSQSVTNENNAAPLILEALGPKCLPSNQPRDGITNRLGMPPLAEKGDYFQTRDALRQSADSKSTEDIDDIDKLMEHPWYAADHPRIAAWLASNEKPLAKFAEASKRTHYFMPYNGGTRPPTLAEIMLPHLAAWREACRALVARAMLKAGQGDIAGAREDCMTAHRLADLLGSGATLVDRLVGYAINNVTSTAEASLAADGKIDPAQAAEWLAALKTLPAISGFADAIDYGERYMYLDLMQQASDHGFGRLMRFFDNFNTKQAAPEFRPLYPLIPMQYARAMRVGNDWYDRIVAAAGKPAGPERRAALSALEKDFNAFVADTRPWHVLTSSEWPIAGFAPGIFKIDERTDAAQAKRDLAVTAMALAAKGADRAAYAPVLEALKPAPPKIIPSELMPAKP